MFHPKCPHCRSPKTIKHGKGRRFCKRCHRTFSLKRKDVRDRAAIEAYVEDRSTYKRLGKRWKVHRTTAYRRVLRALKRRRPLLERTRRSLTICDGICVLDGKLIRIQGKLFTCFVAWDRGLKKPIHFLLKEGGERELWYWRLLLDLERLGYVPKGFVSDGHGSLRELLEERYSNLPHQRCTVHVFLRAKGMVAPGKVKNERAKLFLDLVRAMLWARTEAQAKEYFKKLWNTAFLSPREKRSLLFVWEALPDCFVCRQKRWRHLKLPRSSNAIENVIGQAEARLKTRRGSKNPIASELLLNDLFLRVEEQTITHN